MGVVLARSAEMARFNRSVGSEKSALRVKSPGRNSEVLMTIAVPGFTADSTFLLPATTISRREPGRRRPPRRGMAWISSGRSAIRMWL